MTNDKKTVLVKFSPTSDPVEVTYNKGEKLNLPLGATIVNDPTDPSWLDEIVLKECLRQERAEIESRLQRIEAFAQERFKLIKAIRDYDRGAGDYPGTVEDIRVFKNNNHNLITFYSMAFGRFQNGNAKDAILSELSRRFPEYTTSKDEQLLEAV